MERSRKVNLNTRKKGTYYEGAACEYLKKQGVVILEQNYRCRQGEIDIIARDGDCTVFVEVKYRKDNAFGDALAAVGHAKQRKICRCALVYCMHHPWITSIRYDVIGITDTKVEWIKNAFEHTEYSW